MRRTGGSTLTEVVVALTLVGIVLPGVAAVLAAAWRESSEARARAAMASALLAVVPELVPGSPADCTGLAGARARGGVALRWWLDGGGQPTLHVVASAAAPPGPVADTLSIRLRCRP